MATLFILFFPKYQNNQYEIKRVNIMTLEILAYNVNDIKSKSNTRLGVNYSK